MNVVLSTMNVISMNMSCRISEPVMAGDLVEEPFQGRDLTTECSHCGAKLLTMAGLWVQCDENDPLHKLTVGLERACGCEAAVCAREEEKRAEEAAERKERQEQERMRFEALWHQSGMPRDWRTRGMVSWVRETEAQQVAYRAAAGFGRALVQGERPGGLFVAGDIGTGKTFLASCLAADLVRRGRVVQWCNASRMLREIRESFGNARVSEADVLRRFTAPGLLVIADLGKERPTEWAMEQLFCIVNERYDKRRPLVVTTNYGGEELVRRLTPRAGADGCQDDTTARAIVDRLRAMCQLVVLEGESWRK